MQLKSVKDKIALVMHRCKLNGQKISVRDVLDDATREKIVRLNEGYYIFKDISQKKKQAFAMIQQFGPPAVFISQSAAETKWPELLHALGKSVHRKDYTQEEISSIDFQVKSELIRGDSATVV